MRETVSFGFSNDADDVFMAYGLKSGSVDIPGVCPEFVFADIDRLNAGVQAGKLDVSSISAALYPLISQQYCILTVGASVGRRYGPVVVAREPLTFEALRGRVVAIPGEWTTAHTLFRFYQPDVSTRVVPAAQLLDTVVGGKADAGVVIHEAQLTYERAGLCLVADLGRLWYEDTQLPLPLGLIVARRDLGESAIRAVVAGLQRSIRHAHDTWPDALAVIRRYAQTVDENTLDAFLSRYVNDDTFSLRPDVQQALVELFERGARVGRFPSAPPVDVATA